ncbi:MAG: winged helix-turn-helix transcriptional regulator [Anaerolineae bacterium]|nr:winged helix-turn-helix transcriptional regulator [Anaerolineae bacterium]
MLEINLVQGKPTLEVEFRVSLASDMVHAMSLIISAPQYEGFDQWVYAQHAALPADLMIDMGAVLALLQKSADFSRWLYRALPDAPIHCDFSAFVAGLGTLAAADWERFAAASLAGFARTCRGADGQPAQAPPLHDAAAVRSFLEPHFDPQHIERAVHLLRDPAAFKACALSVVSRFWEQCYREEYRRSLPLMERSVAHHRRQNYQGDLAAIFTAVTGRLLPEGNADDEGIEKVIFIPSSHIGPYVLFRGRQALRPLMVLAYNCRPTAAPGDAPPPAVQDLFPPLKALADETRLQILAILDGQELYAQQIVDRLDISQSAVSRHLQLMVAGGVLAVRKEESMKYFSVNRETLAALAGKLAQFRGIGG